MIITIDGPAGAGKSSAARALAERLSFHFLDTGAMYRVVALAALRRGIDLQDADSLAQLAHDLQIEVTAASVKLDGQDVTSEIRKGEVTAVIHFIADNPEIRSHLVELQRRIALNGNYVTEGRDQGTVAFPDAECKIFLTASPHERARRRMQDLHDRGEMLSYEDVLSRQNERDARDRAREVGTLIAAEDATHINTDGMGLDEVVGCLEDVCRKQRQSRAAS
jgi:cytidylate kinase